MYIDARIKIYIVIALLVLCGGIFQHDLGATTHTSFARAQLTVENLPFESPWQESVISELRTAIYLGQARFLIYTPYPASWIRSIRIQKDGLPEMSATYIAHDDGLGLIVVELDEEAMRLLGPSGLQPLKWNDKFKHNKTGQALKTISMHGTYTDRIVYFENSNESFAPGRLARIPVMEFTGFTKQLQAGDVLIDNGGAVGLICSIDTKAGRGMALPADLLSVFLQKINHKASRILFIDWNKKKSGGALSVLTTNGIELEELESLSQKKYYGLKSDEGAVIVTDVQRNTVIKDGLRKGDLIIKVDNQKVLADGKIMDAGFGVVSVDLFLGYNRGRPRNVKSGVKLWIQRDKARKMITFWPESLSGRNMIIPEFIEKHDWNIFAGLLLHEISGNYLAKNPHLPAFVHSIYKKNALNVHDRNRHIVVLNRVFPLEINKGYNTSNAPVSSIDGVIVENLQHANQLLESAVEQKKQIVIELYNNQKLVIDYKGLDAANQELREQYGIPFLQSDLSK